jgi:nucleoside-diphosphate-sugar epimerase
MRVLLIGGGGFIGPAVVRELQRFGHEVTVFHRGKTALAPHVREIIGDRRRLSDSAAELHALAPDVVIDLILSSDTRAHELMTLFSGARSTTARIVAISSMDVYRACGVTHGLEPGPLEPLPLTESSALRTNLQTYPAAQVNMLQQIFGWLDPDYDKIPVEREILGNDRLPGTVLRLPMVYGPGDRLHRFHPIAKRIADDRRVILFSARMAQWRATKGYVDNVAAAIALAAVSEKAAGRIYNVGEADTLTELEWAQEIAYALNWTGTFITLPDDQVPAHLRAPGNTAQHWVADTSSIRQDLGLREAVSRHDAIRRTADWELANPPTGFTPHQFDYAAEDSALAADDHPQARS